MTFGSDFPAVQQIDCALHLQQEPQGEILANNVRLRAALLANCFVLSSSLQLKPAHALERVEIVGKREYGGEWTGLDYGPGGVGGIGSSDGDDPVGGESVDVAVNPTKDIRCWTSNTATTSRDSPEARHGYAISMYRGLVAAGRTQQVGSWFTVTWADDGSTSYQVVSNGAVAQLAWGNEREKPGDGVAKPGPVCGKG